MKHLPIALAVLGTPAAACGPDTDCAVEDGIYRIHLPDEPEGAGAILFAHGYRGTAEATIGNPALRALVDELGVALIAPKSHAEDWTLPNNPSAGEGPARDEVAYVARVKADAVERFGLDPDRMLAAGFSAGGMLVWNLICDDPGRFAGHAPMSGTFWAPVPESCERPVAPVIHTHGTADEIVPMAGRPIESARQGDVAEALAMYRALGGHEPADPAPAGEGLDCEAWMAPDGQRLELCLHGGGHEFSADHLRRAWDVLID